jgi:hypothetical protein
MLIQNTNGLYQLAKEIVKKRAGQTGESPKHPQRK